MLFKFGQLLFYGVEVGIYKVILLDDMFDIDGNIFIWSNFYCLVIVRLWGFSEEDA